MPIKGKKSGLLPRLVVDYQRADRAVFVNSECCIQLEDKPNPDDCKPHWFCDAVALHLRRHTVFLCEISYAAKLGAMLKRLKEWSEHWPELKIALQRDCKVDKDWLVHPWLFVPTRSISDLVPKLRALKSAEGQPVLQPRITPLGATVPECSNASSGNCIGPARHLRRLFQGVQRLECWRCQNQGDFKQRIASVDVADSRDDHLRAYRRDYWRFQFS